MRILAHDLNKVKAALSHRYAIFECGFATNATETTKPAEDENIWGEGMKIIQKCASNRKPFTPAEKDDFVAEYNSGMSMFYQTPIYSKS